MYYVCSAAQTRKKNYKIVHNDETLRILQWKDILDMEL